MHAVLWACPCRPLGNINRTATGMAKAANPILAQAPSKCVTRLFQIQVSGYGKHTVLWACTPLSVRLLRDQCRRSRLPALLGSTRPAS